MADRHAGLHAGLAGGRGLRTIRGRTPGNVQIAVAGTVLGALLLGLPHRHSMPAWAAIATVVLGVAVVGLCLGITLRDFFHRED